MRIAVVGSRNWKRPNKVYEFVFVLPATWCVVSGRGGVVDKTAEKAARDRQMDLLLFPADWEKHGKKAGMLRNTQIVENCDAVVAFWDGESRGTQDTIQKAQKAGKPVFICGDAMNLEYSDLIELQWGIDQALQQRANNP